MKKRGLYTIAAVGCFCVATVVAVIAYMRRPDIEDQYITPLGSAAITSAQTQGERPANGTTSRVDANLSPESIEAQLVATMPNDTAPPSDVTPLLASWSSLHFLSTTAGKAGEADIEEAIKKVSIENHAAGVSIEDIDSAREVVKNIIMAYSRGRGGFPDYVRAIGGPEALATPEGSAYVKKNYDVTLKILEDNLAKGTSLPGDWLGALSMTWDLAYAPDGAYGCDRYMDRVSFDLSFLCFHEEAADTFREDAWLPSSSSSGLYEESLRRGAPDAPKLYRFIENKTTPVDVFRRDGRIKYFDFLITTGVGDKQPFPVMFRFYKDTTTGKWLYGFSAPFYQRGDAFRPLM